MTRPLAMCALSTPAVSRPSLVPELAVASQAGLRLIAGLDEAGRGAIAGPLVAAAVILPLGMPALAAMLDGVNDSKQLTAAQRASLYEAIAQVALTFGLGWVGPAEIDRHGISFANIWAMRLALAQLSPVPEYLLVDGRVRLVGAPAPQEAIVRGDTLSLSIAAASILAKVTRDRMMAELDTTFPAYGFGRHKGYCTVGHQAALAAAGPCLAHRHTFAPILCQISKA
ncbi:MAG: ribonuclease HII [Candidatus Promineifilaceae bacterium]